MVKLRLFGLARTSLPRTSKSLPRLNEEARKFAHNLVPLSDALARLPWVSSLSMLAQDKRGNAFATSRAGMLQRVYAEKQGKTPKSKYGVTGKFGCITLFG